MTVASTDSAPRRLGRLRVAHAMHEGVVALPADAPLLEVAEAMTANGIHCVVVEGSGGAWGVVSDLDLVAAASVRDLEEQTAGGSAATAAVTVRPDETLERAAHLMTEHETSHLLVVEPETGMPIGILSTLDIADVLVSVYAEQPKQE